MKKIKLFVCDVDGVLTDGKVFYGLDGEAGKFFNVRDGLGFLWLKEAGIERAVLSGKKSGIPAARLKEIQVDFVMDGVGDKLAVFERFCKEHGFSFAETCYVGDDVQDIPVLKKAGLSAAPADAVKEVKKAVKLVTDKKGGDGVVRELAEKIIKRQGKWEKIIRKYC